MKRFNKNIILFAFAVVFVFIGVAFNFPVEFKDAFLVFKDDILSGNIYSIFDFRSKIDDLTEKEISYRDDLMDLNSIKENLLGARVVNKESSRIIKADSGKLVEYKENLTDSQLDSVIKAIKDLENFSSNNGSKFIYIAAPTKEYYEQFPLNIDNHSKMVFDRFTERMSAQGVTFVNPIERIMNTSTDDLYFDTDHHWKPMTGFSVTEVLCQELKALYGFDYNEIYFSVDSYNIKTYEDYFLGSYGKKVGTFFTKNGADNFELITPKFVTDLTEEQPFKNQIRKGTFEETVLYLENIESKKPYELNPYATYSGGDFRLQIMRNNLNSGAPKILLVRDSYACVVSPFLALQASELHMIDIRNLDGYVGERLDVYDYIKKINPDYVIVLYSGIRSMEDSFERYNFKISG